MNPNFPPRPARLLAGFAPRAFLDCARAGGVRLAAVFPKIRHSLAILAFGICLIGALWATIFVKLASEREAEIGNAMKHTANLARAFEEHTLRTLREADQVLRFIVQSHREQGSRLDLRRLAEDGPIMSRIFTYFSIIDERGMLVNGSARFPAMDLSDREHFRVHVGADTGLLFVSKPVVGRASGKPSIQLSRRINKPDLAFGGVAVVSVDPHYFARIYGELDLGRQGVVTLIGRDGTVRVQRSGEHTSFGTALANATVFSHLERAPTGSYVTGSSAGDAISRVFSYRALADYPLVVNVGVATDEVLAGFHRRRQDYFRAAGLASLLIVAFMAFVHVTFRRQERVAATLRRNNHELARAERAARENEERLRQLADNIHEVFWVTDPAKSQMLYISPAYETIWGRSCASLYESPRSWLEAIHPEDRPAVLEAATRRQASGDYDETYRIVRPDGTIRWIRDRAFPARDAAGRVHRVVGIAEDVTEQTRAGAERAQLAAIVETSTDAIVGRSLDGIITSWNASAERLLGWNAREAIGQSISLILPPDRHWRVAANNARFARGEAVERFDTRRLTRDGRTIDVSSSTSPVLNTDGTVIGAAMIFRDITESRKLACMARRKAETTALLESLARAVNESDTPEAALRACLERICRHNNWRFGNVAIFTPDVRDRVPVASLWHINEADRGHFAEFIEISDRYNYAAGVGPFVEHMVQRLQPNWVEDLRELPGHGRLGVAMRLGARSAFGFPVAARGEVLALLQFFADDVRPVDVTVLENMANVASQLARVIERSRSEETNARLAAIVESTNDAIVSRSPDGRILSWNAAAERMFGWTAREAIGQPISIIVPPERRGELGPLMDRLVTGEPIGTVESTHCRRDASRIDTSVSFSAVRNSQAKVVAVSLIYRDITERKRIEREEQRKAQLTRLLESLARAANEATTPRAAVEACLIRIHDYGGWTLCRFAAVAPDTASCLPQESVWWPADCGRFADFIRDSTGAGFDINGGRFIGKVLREKRPVWLPDISQAEDGSRLALAARSGLRSAFAFPVLVNGTVASFLEFFSEEARDPDVLILEAITTVSAQLARLIERARAQTAVKKSESRLRLILDSEPECVKVIEADGTLLEMNRAGLAMLEAESLEQVRSHGLLHFVLAEHRAQFVRNFHRVLAGESHTFEFEIAGLNGTRRWLESHASRLALPGTDSASVLSITRDVTERKRAQEQIAYLSQYDTLTALPNRALFRDRLELAIARATRRAQTAAVMVINLDRFKEINESMGHHAGDRLLREFAQRLRDRFPELDTIARLGGNEFAVLVEGATGVDEITAVAEKIMSASAVPFQAGDGEVYLSPSIGISVYSNGSGSPQELVSRAEQTMARVKQEGGGNYQYYSASRKTASSTRITLESHLRHALERNELVLHYQPKVSFRSGAITGVEALVRWIHPDLGTVSPVEFIPLAEETGLIVPIGEWILRTACAQATSWIREGQDVGIAVNLSPRQFRHKNLLGVVTDVLKTSGLPPVRLELEITETMTMARPEHAATVLSGLRALGVRIALDDFGTGYSSLSHLRRFPLDTVKIDRSFVREIATNAQDVAIIKATIALAGSLGLRTVAEGIEDERQRDQLAALGCDEYQGYLFSPPVPAAALGRLLGDSHGGARLMAVS